MKDYSRTDQASIIQVVSSTPTYACRFSNLCGASVGLERQFDGKSRIKEHALGQVRVKHHDTETYQLHSPSGVFVSRHTIAETSLICKPEPQERSFRSSHSSFPSYPTKRATLNFGTESRPDDSCSCCHGAVSIRLQGRSQLVYGKLE